MRVTVVTAFPEFFNDFLSTSIVGRAVKKGLIQVERVNLRDFGRGGYRQIDDYAFGSGGMVLAAPQLQDALNAARERKGPEGGKDRRAFVICPSPQGPLLTQEIVETLASQEHVIILCGHYEGFDERFIEKEVDLEVSIGDCVLTGGEIPAMAIIDAMSRLIPGVVGKGMAVAEDSFYRGMLDHPHYTRPASWEGMEVPQTLLSGNEADIMAWRRAKAVERTLSRRPDLLARAAIGDYISGGIYLAAGAGGHVGVLGALCRAYGLERPFVVIRNPERRRAFSLSQRTEKRERTEEGGDEMPAPRVMGSLSRVREWITRHENGKALLTVRVCPGSLRGGQDGQGRMHSLEVKRRCLEHDGPVLFLFADSDFNSESDSDFESESEAHTGTDDGVLTVALTMGTGENQNEILPQELAAAIALDRFLGRR